MAAPAIHSENTYHPTLQTRLLTGLPSESPLASKGFLTEKYVEKQLSVAQIAKEISSSKTAVLRALRHFGIHVREQYLAHGRESQSRYGWKLHKGQQALYAKEQDVVKLIKELRADGLSFRRSGSFQSWRAHFKSRASF
jgi:hypothetical protein